MTRRGVLGGAAVLAAGGTASAATDQQRVDPAYKVRNGRIRQSVMGWCFQPLSAVQLARHAAGIGLVAIEGIAPEHYPAVRELGLKISLVSSHGFARGPLKPDYHPFVIDKLRSAIDLAVEVGCDNVITFTGMRESGITDERAAQNCIECWKQVIGYAERMKVNLCLEHLNSRDATHPMKGHPGYFGDNLDCCIDLIRRVDSPRMKLLFDIYHVQVMHGDVIRRMRQCKDYVAHYHTAGNPGRGELDDTQEINYPAVMRAIVDSGYSGYVAQEFIPTWADKIEALRHAAKVCDV